MTTTTLIKKNIEWDDGLQFHGDGEGAESFIS